jgi:hypothetical protein
MAVNSARLDVCPGISAATFIIYLIAATMLFSVVDAWAGVEIDCPSSLKAYSIDPKMSNYNCNCSNGNRSMPVCTPKSGSSKKSLSGSKSSSRSMNNAIKLQLFQGLLDGMMQGPKNKAPSRQQQEAQQEAQRQQQMQREQKERELEFARQKDFAEKKDHLLGTLKGSSTGTLVDFKNLDGDAETMRKAAGDPFDQPSVITGKIEISSGTNFFGTTLTEPEISTLMEPENDPIIVDLRDANTFVVQSLKQNKEEIKKIEKPKKEEKKQKTERRECKEIIAKYNKQVGDMQKFQKQIKFTESQLDEWKQKNDAAFWNAVIDGSSFAVGEFFDYLKETRSGAENIKRNLELIETKLIKGNVYTPAQIESLKTKLNLRMAEYTISKYTSEFSNIADYFDYVKNVIQSSVTKIGETDADIKELLSNPKVKEYLSEYPTIDAAQFLAGKSITAFLARKGFSKYSYVGIAQLVVNTAYNATDMYLSYKNICTLRNASGKELESAKYIQSQITNTYNKIVECRVQ